MDPTGVNTLAEAISKYGLFAVLVAVLILAFILMIKLLLKYVSKLMDSLMEQNKAYFEEMIKAPSEPKILDAHLQINEMVGMQLRKLRDLTDADRSFIYMFHNTDHGIGGFPFLKATCFYEWSLSTVKALLGKQRDIPVFLLADALSSLGRGEPFVTRDISADRNKYPALATYMEEVDSRSTVLYPLRSHHTGVIGFLGIDFTHLPISEEEEKSFVEAVASTAVVVQAILDSAGGDSIHETAGTSK